MLGLRNFCPETIRWCLMHVCHLGIMMVANGSGLKPALLHYYILSFANAPSQKIKRIRLGKNRPFHFQCTSGANLLSGITHCFFSNSVAERSSNTLRNLLIRSGVYGDPGTRARSVLCSKAYLDFKNFCSLNKISCSQPVFKERYVTLLCSIISLFHFFMAHVLICCDGVMGIGKKRSIVLKMHDSCHICLVLFWLVVSYYGIPSTFPARVRICWSQVYHKNGDIIFSAKAFNGRCILEWLSHAVYVASLSDEYVQTDERFVLIAAALTLVWYVWKSTQHTRTHAWKIIII